MIKVKMPVRRMEDGEAELVSIVDKPANRVPFRKLASEDAEGAPMIDVGTGFKGLFVKKSAAPGLLAILVAPDADLGKAAEVLKAAGLAHDEVQEMHDAEGQATAQAFIQRGDTPLGGDCQVTIKVDEGAYAVVQLDKAFEPFSGGTSFTENLKAQSFLPSVRGALSALDDTLFEIAFAADEKSDMVEMTSKAAEEFATAISSMVAQIPESVFKFERAVKNLAGVTGAGSPPSGGSASDESGDEVAGSPESDSPRGSNSEVADGMQRKAEGEEATQKAEEEEAPAEGADEAQADEAQADEARGEEAPNYAELFKAETAALEDKFTSAIDNLAKTLTEAITGVAQRVEKTEKRIKGSVPSAEAEDDRVFRGDQGGGYPEPPLMDSGMDDVSLDLIEPEQV